MSAAKVERLLNLTMALMSTRRYLTVADIARLVPGYEAGDGEQAQAAFHRMFERDKDELRALGIPLETGTQDAWGTELGYRIAPEEYALPEVMLEPDEAAALALAGRLWGSAQLSTAAQAALRKLGAGGQQAPPAAPNVGVALGGSEPAFDAVFRAAADHRVIHFEYRASGQPTAQPRRLQPWGLVHWRGRWYVVGNDLDRAAPRVFRLGRIVGAPRPHGPGGAFETPDGLDLRAVVTERERTAGDPVPVQVLVRRGTAHALRATAAAVGDPDAGAAASGAPAAGALSDYEVQTHQVADLDGFADRLAGYGRDVRALAPPDLVDRVRSRLAGALAAHQPAAGDR